MLTGDEDLGFLNYLLCDMEFRLWFMLPNVGRSDFLSVRVIIDNQTFGI